MFVVFIHGPAAAGKYTIGSILGNETGLPLFHNHLAVDLAKTLFEFGSDQFNNLRETIWLSSFAEAARANKSFIFTFNPEATVNRNIIEKLHDIIESNGGKIFYVELLCSDIEVVKRIENESRKKFGKLADASFYLELKSQGAFCFRELPQPVLTIDTERNSAIESANEIKRYLEANTSQGAVHG